MTNHYYSKNGAAGQAEAFVAENLTGLPDPKTPGNGPGSISGGTVIVDPLPPQGGLTRASGLSSKPSSQTPTHPHCGLPGIDVNAGFPVPDVLRPEENASAEREHRPMPADCQGTSAEDEELRLYLRYLLSEPKSANSSTRDALERGGRVRGFFKRVFTNWGNRRGNRPGGALLGAIGDSINESAQIAEVVIGPDNRYLIDDTTRLPFSGCTQLDIVGANGSEYVGSASLIARSETASVFLTAAHCVYFHDGGGYAHEVVVSPGRNEDSFPYGRHTARPSAGEGDFIVPDSWIHNRSRNDDWALIVVRGDVSGPAGIPFVFDFSSFADDVLYGALGQVSGYPVDMTNFLMDSTRQFYHADQVSALTSRVIGYMLDTTGGQSGSGFYVHDDSTGQRIIAGVHTMGSSDGNSATRITPEIAAHIADVVAAEL